MHSKSKNLIYMSVGLPVFIKHGSITGLLFAAAILANTALGIVLHGRYLTFHGSPDTCITITTTWDGIDTIRVIYDTNIGFPNPDTITSFSSLHRHHVEFNGLENSSWYYYKIQDDHGNDHTDIDSFKTANIMGTEGHLTLLLVADFQPNAIPEGQAERDSIRGFVDTVRAQISRGQCPYPDLILNLGDWVSGRSSAVWDSIIAILDTLHELAPLLPTIGNHDYYCAGKNDSTGYVYHFNLPASGLGSSWSGDHQYVLDYQNIRFLSVSMCDAWRSWPQDQVAAGSAQYNWIDSILTSTPSEIEYIIEMHHVNLIPLPWNIKNGAPDSRKMTWQDGIYNDPGACNTPYDTLRYEYFRDVRPLLETANAISLEGHAWFCTATTNFSASKNFGNLPIICCAGGNGWNTNKQSFCTMYLSDSGVRVDYHKVDTWPGAEEVAAGYPWEAAASDRIFTIYYSPEYCVSLEPEYSHATVEVGDSCDYTLTVLNCGLDSDTYALNTANVPAGWNATIYDSGGTIPIDSIGQLGWGESADFVVRLVPPPDTPYGTYTADVTAESRYGTGNTQIDTTTIVAEICPVYSLPFFDSLDHGGSDPSCWTIIDGGSIHNYEGTWHAGRRSDNDYYMVTDSDAEGYGETQNEQLISPVIDCSAATAVSLRYWHSFQQYSTSESDVDISINQGPWQNIVSYTEDTEESTFHNISFWAAGRSDVRIRFHYTACDDWWWKVDSVAVESCVPLRIEDLTISLAANTTEIAHVVLSWSDFPGAAQYKVYKSTESWQTGYVLIGSTVDTQYTDSSAVVGTTKSYYYVTADSEAVNAGIIGKTSLNRSHPDTTLPQGTRDGAYPPRQIGVNDGRPILKTQRR